jgi:hypothetical protein
MKVIYRICIPLFALLIFFGLSEAADNFKGEFFDDFHYYSPSDSLLVLRGWQIAEGNTGPPAGAYYSAAQISFESDKKNAENRIMYLKAEHSEMDRNARIETPSCFYEGTYAARVFFDNSLRKRRDGNVQAFYTINRLRFPNDSLYSECDMEYLPYDTWHPENNRSKLYLSTWASYQEDPWQADLRSDTLQGSLHGWHLLLIQICDGSCVRYFLDKSENILAEHCYSESGSSVYPDTPMRIAFTNRIILSGQYPDLRESRMGVDWIYFNADTCMGPEQVLNRIRELQRDGIPFYQTP